MAYGEQSTKALNNLNVKMASILSTNAWCTCGTKKRQYLDRGNSQHGCCLRMLYNVQCTRVHDKNNLILNDSLLHRQCEIKKSRSIVNCHHPTESKINLTEIRSPNFQRRKGSAIISCGTAFVVISLKIIFLS